MTPRAAKATIAAIGVAALALYAVHLDQPRDFVFDESFYVPVARQIEAGRLMDGCDPGAPINGEHPPLAKLILAGSLALLEPGAVHYQGCRYDEAETSCSVADGEEVLVASNSTDTCLQAFVANARQAGNPIAWRLPSAVLGSAAVVLTGLAARRLAGATAGILAATVIALDPLMLVMSRVAMLDIYPTAFVAGALLAATHPTRTGRLATALLLALAFSCKFATAFLFLPVLAVGAWSHHRAQALSKAVLLESVAMTAAGTVAVWVVAYAPWLAQGYSLGQWWTWQVAAVEWDTIGYEGHPYDRRAWLWFLPGNGTPLYDPRQHVGVAGGPITASPSPLLLLLVLAGLGYHVLRLLPAARPLPSLGLLVRQAPMATQTALVWLMAAVVGYGGFWFLQRVTFAYYAVLLVPIFAIGVAAAFAHLPRRHLAAGAAGLAVILALMAPAALAYL